MAELGVAREACLGVATGPISPRSRSPTVPSAGVPKVAVGLEMSRHWQPLRDEPGPRRYSWRRFLPPPAMRQDLLEHALLEGLN